MQVLPSQLIHAKLVQMVTGPHLVDQLRVVMSVEQDTIAREVFDQAVVQVSGRVMVFFLQIRVVHHV